MKPSMNPCSLLLSAVLLSLAGAASTVTIAPAGIQSGPDIAGSTFAASTTYDPLTHSVLITGSTFGRFFSNNGNAVSSIPRKTSNCFLATVSLPTSTSAGMQWKILQTVGDAEDVVREACSASLYHQNHNKLIVLGYSEQGGFMDTLYEPSLITQATQYGILFDMDVAPDGTTPFHLAGGRVMQESRVTYPIMLASTPSDEWIYVVAQETDNVARNDQGVAANNGETVVAISDEVDPMRFFMYGDNYHMSIARYKASFPTGSPTTNLQETFAQGWRTILATTDNAAVHVAGITEIGNIVVVLGSTAGHGTDVGGADAAIGEGTMSGFITKYSKNNGTRIGDSRRIQSIDGRNDWLAGMCNDPNDPNHIYITGATEGQLDGTLTISGNGTEAFVMKVLIGTLETIWTKQLGAAADVGVLTQVRGISCALSPDGVSIWFGGVVQAGAVLYDAGTKESYGGNDIFVAKLRAEDGQVAFVRQIGSKEDDGLAMRGGLAVDQYGNCVVVGNTYGSFYRERQLGELEDEAWISDVFVTTISGDTGAVAPPLAPAEFNNGPNVSAVEPTSPASNQSSNGLGPGMIVLVVFACVGFLAFACFARSKSKINRDVTTDRTHVIQFLNEFDVEDIDLKHSATGGWHCSYSNDLANGRNRRAERGSAFGSFVPPAPGRSLLLPASDPLLTAPLTNSSVLQDSLFMDDEDSSEYGGGLDDGRRFGQSHSSQRQGYAGLIDAYNTTWDDGRLEPEATDSWGKEIL